MYKRLLILLSLVSLSFTICFSQAPSSQDTVFVSDTLIIYDTIKVPKKIIIEKTDAILEDSTKTTNTITEEIVKKQRRPKAFIIRLADYMHFGIDYRVDLKKLFGVLSIGCNIQEQAPIILGIGGGYKIPITEKIQFEPTLYSYLYVPLSLNFGTTNYNHLNIGFKYKYSRKLAFHLTPSFYFSPKSNIINSEHYDNIIAYVSPIKPVLSKQTSSSTYTDVGIGISFGVELLID